MNLSHFTSAGSMPEFVGTTVLDTIGLVIANVDDALLKKMNYDKSYRSIGLFSSRTGAAGQILAIDEATKATNCEVLSIDLPRDTKGWGGHGNFIVVGSRDVADARRCIEIALEKTTLHAGEVYISEAGHLEFAFSARAGAALQMGFQAPLDKAFGFICGSPAAIGLLIADMALKTSNVEIIQYLTPSIGTSHSNEVIITITGDTVAVKEAVILARTNGLLLLEAMGSKALSPTGIPYLL
jgi:microcompartment protein PduB